METGIVAGAIPVDAIGRYAIDDVGYLKELDIAVSSGMAYPALLCYAGLVEDTARGSAGLERHY